MADSRSVNVYNATRAHIIAIAVLTAWGLFYSIGLLPFGSQGPGYYGMEADDGLTVGEVDPGWPAYKAGIVEGDTLDERHTPFDSRRAAGWGWQLPAVGAHETLRIIHKGNSRPVTLTAARLRDLVDPVDKIVARSQGLVGAIYVILGALLVLLRPSKMTWAFFIYCVGVNPATLEPISLLYWIPHWLWNTLAIGSEALKYVGFAAIVVFAARFPLDRAAGKLQHAVQIGALLFLAVFLPEALYSGIAPIALFKAEPPLFRHAADIAINIGYLAALAAFIAMYRQADAVVKQRMRWVIMGFAVGYGVRVMLHIPEDLGLAIPPWIPLIQTFLSLAIPVSVVYSILKYRVFDISFIISRAITAGVLAVFAFVLIDWLSATYLSKTRSTVALAIAVALVIGFAARVLYARADRLTDRLLFRDRFEARKRLATVIDHLRHAGSHARVEELLTHDVAQALDLASSAAFRPTRDGGFVRSESTEWPPLATWHVLPDDPAAADFASQSIKRLGPGSALGGLAVPEGPGAPALAVPVQINGEVCKVLLYGAHRNGSDFNPQEINELRWLAIEAGTASAYLRYPAPAV